jgi:hypothetical protein
MKECETSDQHAERLALQFKPQLDKYRALCALILSDESNDQELWDDVCFSSFSMGYFMAEGIGPVDAYNLSTYCRYRWDGFC